MSASSELAFSFDLRYATSSILQKLQEYNVLNKLCVNVDSQRKFSLLKTKPNNNQAKKHEQATYSRINTNGQ